MGRRNNWEANSEQTSSMAGKWSRAREVAPVGRCRDTQSDDTCPDTHHTHWQSPTYSGKRWGPSFPKLATPKSITSPGSCTKLTKLCHALYCHGDPLPCFRGAQGLKEEENGVARQEVRLPGPRRAWWSFGISWAIKEILRRRDVWANPNGEGGTWDLESWTWVLTSSRVYY